MLYIDLLIAQDLWQNHYQILSIIFLKEFIELNVNADTIIKAVLNISIATVILNSQTLKIIQKNTIFFLMKITFFQQRVSILL